VQPGNFHGGGGVAKQDPHSLLPFPIESFWSSSLPSYQEELPLGLTVSMVCMGEVSVVNHFWETQSEDYCRETLQLPHQDSFFCRPLAPRQGVGSNLGVDVPSFHPIGSVNTPELSEITRIPSESFCRTPRGVLRVKRLARREMRAAVSENIFLRVKLVGILQIVIAADPACGVGKSLFVHTIGQKIRASVSSKESTGNRNGLQSSGVRPLEVSAFQQLSARATNTMPGLHGVEGRKETTRSGRVRQTHGRFRAGILGKFEAFIFLGALRDKKINIVRRS